MQCLTYVKHPGFTPLKVSIQPQKIWNDYNIKKTPILNFHAVLGYSRCVYRTDCAA